MCLRYSFGLGEAADLVDAAITRTLAAGIRTRDIASDGMEVISTDAMGDAIVREIEQATA
jgi:3-isopropylmalate dehydrogenase